MWTQDKVIDRFRVDGSLRVVVRYQSDDHPSFEKVHDLAHQAPADWLKMQIQAELDRLNGLDVNEAQVIVGDPIDLTPADPVEPSDDDKARKAYLDAVFELTRLKDVLKSDDPDLATQYDLVKQLLAALPSSK